MSRALVWWSMHLHDLRADYARRPTEATRASLSVALAVVAALSGRGARA